MLRTTAAVLVVLASCLFGSSAALATQGHTFADQFGPAPFTDTDGNFQGGGPNGIAIRQATGDVFVADGGHTDGAGVALPRIERFDTAGVFQSDFTIDASLYVAPGALAVDPNGTGAVYVGAVRISDGAGVLLKYSAAGVFQYAVDASTSGTTLTNPISVAVDPVDGTVYVNATDNATTLPVIDKFDDTGAFISSFDGSGGSAPDGAFGFITGLAVDGNQDVFVTDPTRNKVYRYDASGAYQSTVDDGSQGGVAAVTVNPANDDVYIVENGPQGSAVARYNAGGATRVDQFGFTKVGNAAGVAVLGSNGAVYTPDANNAVVERFVTFAGATVVTTAQTGVTATGATLNGTVNPQGIAGTSYHFEYGTDQSYGTSTADTDPGAGSSNVPASVALTGLLPNTVYHYRLVATNAAGTIYGLDRSFTTTTAPPVLDETAPLATDIMPGSVKLNGSVNPRGSDTTYHFDYGTTTAYGTSTADAGPINGQGSQAVNSNDPNTGLPTVTGLVANTTYHFRLSADNGTGGVQHGVDQVFYTPPVEPAGAASVTGVSAVLSGTVNPHGSAATYVFQYGTTTAYGTTTPAADAGSTDGNKVVQAEVLLLSPGTTYHVRLVKTETLTGVVTTGVDGTFSTNPAPSEAAATVSGLTTTHAAFSATYDTHGLGGSTQFVIASTTSAFLAQTESVEVSDTGTTTGELSNLVPGETYTVRLSVKSSGVTTLSDPVVFSTPALPINPPPPPPNISPTPYGCTAPHIDPVNTHPKPGDTVTVTGSDLGVGGTIALGNTTVTSTTWTATKFTFLVPDDATGTQALTINCATVSNTVGLAVFHEASNQFSITKTSVKGATASVSVKVPGPGTIKTSAANTAAAKKSVLKASSATIKIKLSAVGKKALAKAKSRRLSVSLKVTYTPAGGKAKTITKSITYKRGGTR